MRTNSKLRWQIAAAFIAINCVSNSEAQTQTIILSGSMGPASINVPVGKVFEVIAFGSANFDTFLVAANVRVMSSDPADHLSTRAVLVGPITVGFSTVSGGYLTYKISDNSTVVGQNVPSTAVVIPSDATGPVQIILESSLDLVTWTPALPGSYGASTALRFFRVRAVEN